MQFRNVTFAVIATLATAVLANPAIASAAPRAASVSDAVAAAGPAPKCSQSFQSRYGWALRVANASPIPDKDPDAYVKLFYQQLQVCVGDGLRINGQAVKAPKSPGVALPNSFDFGGTHVVVPDTGEHAEPVGDRRTPSERSTRQHGVCTVSTYAPSYQGPNPHRFYTVGNIHCTGATNVILDLVVLRRYNSTGTTVVYDTAPRVSDTDGDVGTLRYTNCAPASTFAGRSYGQRLHAGTWDGAYAFSTYSSPCPT